MPVTHKRYISISFSILLLVCIPLWLYKCQPFLYRLPNDFSYHADVISYDNFYDKDQEVFLGEQRSLTTFSYTTKDLSDDVQIIENIFDVRTISGEQIVSIQRDYAIDRYTGAHTSHPLYKERSGYLFAPRMKGLGAEVPDKSSFYYWHVNYDQAIRMDFFGEKIIAGLPVYVYNANAIVDQTKELSAFLPGVGNLYGMKLFVNIQLYIEPYTGRLISYEDKTDAIYVDFQSKDELYPWNSFHNVVAPHSVQNLANAAQIFKQKIFIINISVVLTLLILSLLIIFWPTIKHTFFPQTSLEAPQTKRLFFPIFIFLWFFISVCVLAYLLYQIIYQQRLAEFETEAKSFTDDITARLDVYKGVLQGGVGLFNASDVVDRAEWHAFVNSLNIQSAYPGIQGVGYAQVIPSSTKYSFIDTVRSEGFPEFTISPEGDRDPLTSILYLEPFDERNRRAFGYDMFSEETRRIAMIFARDSGEASISGKITLLQETNVDIQPGFLMYLAVYKHHESLTSVNERRENILGYVYSPFRMYDFMRAIIAERPTVLQFEIFDGLQQNEQSEDHLFFRSSNDSVTNSEFTYTSLISFGNRSWTIVYHSPPAYGLDVFRRQTPIILMILGFIFSVFLYIILYIVFSQRDRALRIAHQMTKDLHRRTNTCR